MLEKTWSKEEENHDSGNDGEKERLLEIHRGGKYLISNFECILHDGILIQSVVVHGHEERVNPNGERNGEFRKGIKDDEGDALLDEVPREPPVPDTENVNAAETSLNQFLFQLIPFLLLICTKMVGRHY